MYDRFKNLFNKFKYKETSIKKNPFGTTPLASKDYYLTKFKKAISEKFDEIDEFEKKCNFSIDKNWIDNLALHTQVVKKKSEINYQHGRILYSLLSHYLYLSKKNNDNILIFETGTARGFSSICMSKAINDRKMKGLILTLDVLPHNEKIYWNCIDDHDGKKSRQELLNPWQKELKNIHFLTGPSSLILKKINCDRINFAFIDGMHNDFNVRKEFKFISLKQTKGDYIIFDDYSTDFPDIVRFINEIREDDVYDIKIISSAKVRSYAILQKKI